MASQPPARPDVIIILTDEERAVQPHEDPTLAQWRNQTLAARRWFDDNGVSFTRHYTGSVACVPSRPTLFTGHYPDVHGVTQTDGMGKGATDSRMRWLRPGEVPTLGHWFRSAGYDTHYDGKWHISHADLHDPATGAPIATNTDDGTVLHDGVASYLAADALDVYGFSGWVGPEPHGAAPANSGLRRDPLVAARVSAWLADRYQRRLAGDPDAARPFVCVASFVNPHDIVFFPAWINNPDTSPVSNDPWGTPPVAASPSADEDLSTKPGIHSAYRDNYPTGYGPAEIVGSLYNDNADDYRRTYLRLHADVDGPIDVVRTTVTEAAANGAAPGGTVLVRSSDHGEMLGAHGGMHQKWFILYDEAVRIPLAIVELDGDGQVCTTSTAVDDTPTSHVDLLPTLLDAAGISVHDAATDLADRFTEVHTLPGRSLWPLVHGATDPDRTVYLQTRDNILEGDDVRTLVAQVLDLDDPPVNLQIAVAGAEPSNVEAVVGRVHDHQAPGGASHLWKLVRTFDDPACWTEPGVRQLATSGPDGESWRTDVLDDQWELYDLHTDPIEVHNLATHPNAAAVFDHLTQRLASERQRCVPQRNVAWPYATNAGRVSATTGHDLPQHPDTPASHTKES
jgi:arylsulfatase A-like enzyme